MLKRALGCLFFSCVLLPAQTQRLIDFNRHGWYIYSGDHRVSERWGFHFDGQYRRSNVITRWQQYQARPGINFHATPNIFFTLGYAYTRTYPYGDYPVLAAFPEHRIYQQAMIRHPRRSVTLLQRYRMEQRFIRYPQTSDRVTYQNRFRYSLKADVPIVRDASGRPLWYFTTYDEILLGIPPNFGARSFDQNRLFAGIGKSLGAFGNLEVGYLNQFIGQRNGRIFEFNNTLFVAISSNYPLFNFWRK